MPSGDLIGVGPVAYGDSFVGLPVAGDVDGASGNEAVVLGTVQLLHVKHLLRGKLEINKRLNFFFIENSDEEKNVYYDKDCNYTHTHIYIYIYS